jgi:serine/threonine-protein kinase
MPAVEEVNSALPSRITVAQQIHEGGQRVVYDVRVGDERRVLKLIPAAARARSEREVLIGRTFDHPNLSKVLDEELSEVEVDGEMYVYFTETFIEGEPLSARTQRMSPCEALSLVGELTSAVAYLWQEHHVVHRDIKPLNIMERPGGGFVLLDIGVARHQDRSTLTVISGEHQPGTIGYLAPEQLAPLKGREIDYRADLFAVGVVAYEQVTGALPFDPDAPSYRTLLTTGVRHELQNQPEALRRVLDRLLAPRPHGRFRLDRVEPAITQAMEELECS